MKSFGFALQQNKDGDGEDYLVYRNERSMRMVTKGEFR
jgi:hypothetical protein